MRITCAKSELLKSINIVMKAVPVRTTLTIQLCILIDAQGSTIRFTGNDTELGIETIVNGRIDERGMIALDAKIFSEMIRKLPESDVTIMTDGNLNTTILCENSVINIMGMDGEDFTRIPVIDRDASVRISQYSLREMIRQTIFSIAASDTNKIMTGELFEINGNKLRAASLDGHRISIRKIELGEEHPAKKVIVPGKTLNEVSKILTGDVEDVVDIYLGENHILFEFDDTVVVSRLIDGTYFRIDQMISADYETKVRINRKLLLDCIDRSTLLYREEDRKPIVMTITEDLMELKISSQIGSMNEKIGIEMDGRDLMIGFNPKYLLDALRAIEDEEITIYYMNSKSPCIIRNEEDSYIYLILPINFIA